MAACCSLFATWFSSSLFSRSPILRRTRRPFLAGAMVAPSSSARPPRQCRRPCRKRAAHLPPPPRCLYPRRMIAFVLRRLLQSLLVILVVALVAFGLFRYVGDPINNMVGQDTSEVDRAALRQRLGLYDPVPVQFARFIGNAAHRAFGLPFRPARKRS